MSLLVFYNFAALVFIAVAVSVLLAQDDLKIAQGLWMIFLQATSLLFYLNVIFGHFSVVHDCWKQVWPNKIFNCLPWSSRNLVLLQKRPALFSECEGSCMACLVRMFYSKMKILYLWMQMYFWTSLLSTQKGTFSGEEKQQQEICLHSQARICYALL